MSLLSAALLFSVLFAAVAAGWYLGFRQGRLRRRLEDAGRVRQYIQGQARAGLGDTGSLTAVAQALAFDPENFEAHLSLGALFRRRGEIGRATEVHQRLRGLAGLSPEQVDHVDLELGRDYFAGGVLDRAELQFQSLVDRHSQFAQQALRQLLRIYELERDWHSALSVAERLAVVEPAVNRMAAHYCCELAERAASAGEPAAARRQLRRALDMDPHCLRARIALVQQDVLAGQVDAAIAGLREALLEGPAAALLVRDALARWVARLPLVPGQPVPTVEALLAAALPEQEPPAATPTHYRCSQCGFHSRSLLWACPGCNGWGTLQALRASTPGTPDA